MKEGEKAPEFKLHDGDGNVVSLKDFIGKKVVLYFYPKDNTPSCIQEACDFRNLYSDFEVLDIVIIGISADPEKSHKDFSSKYELPFRLLSDPDQTVLRAYGVLKEKRIDGKKHVGLERTTFIIDEDGKIEKIFTGVKVNGHAAEVMDVLY